MKSFYYLLGNTIIANVTNMTVWFALIYFVFLETRSVFATAIVSGIFLVATAVSGFWFGSLVDHHKKKQIMLVSSVISLVMYVAGFAIYLSSSPHVFKNPANIMLWILVTILMLGVIAGNIRGIALPTAITFLVPEKGRDKANGMAGAANGIGFLITSVISGFLVGLGGMYYVLLLATIMTIATFIHLWTITIPEKKISHTDEQPNKIDIRGTLAVVSKIPGMFALILFTTFNNFLGGVFMALMDAYGLSLVPVQTWGLLWGFLSVGFIVGGLIITKWGLGKNPLRAMFSANIVIWTISTFFTIQPSIILLASGMFIYLCVVPYIEASEHTIIQKLVPPHRQGRVFGFAQSIEQTASPLTAFLIGPIAQFVFIPFMTTGAGVDLIGSWYGTGSDRGIALVFTIAGLIGLGMTLIAMNTKYYTLLSHQYLKK